MDPQPLQFHAVAVVSLRDFLVHSKADEALSFPVFDKFKEEIFSDVVWGTPENKHTLVTVDYVFNALRDALESYLGIFVRTTEDRVVVVDLCMSNMKKNWNLAWQSAHSNPWFPEDHTFPAPFIDIEN